MVKDANSKVATEDAVAEGGTKEGADFRAAMGEAEGDTRIRGIASKETTKATITKEIITKVTTIKTTSSSKGIIMITTMDTTGGKHLPWDKVKETGEINKPTKEGIKSPRGIILNKLRRSVQGLMGCGHWDIWGRGGAIV